MRNTLRDAIRAVNRTVVVCGSAVTLSMLANGVSAQADAVEEVLVQGVRAAQASAVNTKREAVSVVDGISAEDIGKLPDVTISDSLQRIPGVQVERTAGESGPVQIRGLPYVASSLNGESFLSATTIDTAGADFGDLPSQLFTGASVYKSPLATLTTLGVVGSVDLKTRRPFDLQSGWTYAATAEVDQGSISEETDPTVTGLVGWQNETVGFLLTAATTEKNLASDFNGYFDTSENGSIGAANNNHLGWDSADTANPGIYHIVPQGFAAFHKAEERHRDGINASLQFDLSDGVELVVDHFFSDQERWNRRAGISQNNRWQSFNNYARPVAWGENDFTVEVRDDEGNLTETQNWRTVSAFDARPFRLQSFAQTNYNHEESNNSNIELNFKGDEALTGQVRITRATAKASMRHGYSEGDLLSIDQGSLVTGPGGFIPADQCDTSRGDIVAGADGGCFAAYSPGGIEDNDFLIRYDARGEHPVFSGFDQVVDGGAGPRSVAAYMADINSYHVGAFSSEGNTDDDATMNTFSTKWNYEFSDSPFITSVDFGVRNSDREVDRTQFSYFAEFDDTGCAAQWKAVDQFAGTSECDPSKQQGEMVTGVDQAGNVITNQFVNYTLLNPTRLDEFNNVIFMDDFGPVKGLPGVWVADPRDYDDTLAFQERVFGPQRKVIDPGQSYSVGLDEFSYFVQANFEYGILSGNLGVKVVETDLVIRQNEVGASIPHSGASLDIGDVKTQRSYTDVLPALNTIFSVTDDIKIRASYGETMQPLNLIDWGGGKRVGKVFNDDCQCMRVANGELAGNPELDPTRGENYDLSAEWYVGNASMLSLGFYQVKIESFVSDGTILMGQADDDGIDRGPFVFTAPVQGRGGEVKGVEIAAKFALSDVTDAAFISNLGFDVNYTKSESSQDEKGINGKELSFPNNSEDTYNLVAWYENDVISTRLAYNFRSERLITQGNAVTGLQGLYQDDYGQLDLNVTYNMNEMLSFYLNGSNILEEYQDTYLEFKDQKAFQNIYEARWALGVRFKY